jgi:hypothetical protein
MKTLLCGVVCIVSILQTQADILVTNISDAGPGSLRNAIQLANAPGGGTIRVQTNLTGTITLLTPLPVLTQNITVIGPGAVQLSVNGGGIYVLTNAAGNTATIEGLTVTVANFGNLSFLGCNVTTGLSPDRHGACLNAGNMHATNCMFSGMTAADVGGAILNSGSLIVSACTFTNNACCALDNEGGTIQVENSTLAKSYSSDNGAGGRSAGIWNESGTVVVRNCSITNNSALRGGGIWNGGTLTVSNSTLAQNRASYSSGPMPGGAIFNDTNASATLVNTTVSGNYAMNQGGGILNLGTLWLLNCTIASNQAYGNPSDGALAGGGIWNSGNVHSKNTIIAGNTVQQGQGPDFFGNLDSLGFNLIQNAAGCTNVGVDTGDLLGVDPLLGPLQDNGGPTYTHALLPGSPAIDAATSNGAPGTDQRGLFRPQGPAPDIGAFEVPNLTSSLKLKFDFEDSGTTTMDSIANVSLQLVDASGAPADLHGIPGSGVGGYGKALAFTGATMGTNGPMAFTTNNFAVYFGTLNTFTLTLWIKPASSLLINAFPRFFTLGSDGLTDRGVANSLQLLSNGNAQSGTAVQGFVNTMQTSTSSFGTFNMPANQWSFLALTYDGATLKFYGGSETNPVSLQSSAAFVAGPVTITDAWTLMLGNRLEQDRAFAGQMDVVRFYSTALPMSGLENVRATAVALPAIAAYPSGANIILTLNTRTNALYILQSTPNLTLPAWTSVSTNTGLGSVISNSIPINPAAPQQFFRYLIR